MSAKYPTLRKELRQAGAKNSETAKLVEVADQLQSLKSLRMFPNPAKDSRQWWRRQIAVLGVVAIAGILTGAGLIAYSQTSLPGSWLYPAKRLSEKVAVAFDPSYRETLMMRRSQEVTALVRQQASEHAVLATLAAYRSTAAAYKSANYPAFECCKSNLEQAIAKASPPERTAINTTLASLQT